MIAHEELTEGTLVVWQGPNGMVRGVVETLPGGESAVTLEDGKHMDLNAVAGTPSSKVVGRLKLSAGRPVGNK